MAYGTCVPVPTGFLNLPSRMTTCAGTYGALSEQGEDCRHLLGVGLSKD